MRKKKILKIILIISISILLLPILYISAFSIYMRIPQTYVLKPASPYTGAQLVTKTTHSFRGNHSKIYIRYPNSTKLIDTGESFGVDEARPGLTRDDAPYTLTWINEHEAKIEYIYAGPDVIYEVTIQY